MWTHRMQSRPDGTDNQSKAKMITDTYNKQTGVHWVIVVGDGCGWCMLRAAEMPALLPKSSNLFEISPPTPPSQGLRDISRTMWGKTLENQWLFMVLGAFGLRGWNPGAATPSPNLKSLK